MRNFILLFVLGTAISFGQTYNVSVKNNNLGSRNYGQTSNYTVTTKKSGINYSAYSTGASVPTASYSNPGNAAANGFKQGYQWGQYLSNSNSFAGLWAAKRAKHRRNIAKLRVQLSSETNLAKRKQIINKISRKQAQLNRILNY